MRKITVLGPNFPRLMTSAELKLCELFTDIPSILATPQKQFPVYGTPQIVIKCNISSSPTATSVGWERISLDGSSTEAIVAAVSNGKYHIDDSLVYPHLTINDVSFADDAYFTCFAANVAGKGISNSARVDVIDCKFIIRKIRLRKIFRKMKNIEVFHGLQELNIMSSFE